MNSEPCNPCDFFYKRPDELSSQVLDQIKELIREGREVGSAYLRENLQNAFLIGYAADRSGKVVGTVTLKRPKQIYRKKIEHATGLHLDGYLERGYTSITPGHRRHDVADTLIKGLINRSQGEKVYTTIRLDNTHALNLTYKNGMVLAATFIHWRTGNEIGVFVNQF